MSITVLYHYANEQTAYYEVQFDDVEPTAALTERCCWLLQEQGGQLRVLTLRGAYPEEEFQYREFKEAELQFNEQIARLRREGTARYEILDFVDSSQLSSDELEHITAACQATRA